MTTLKDTKKRELTMAASSRFGLFKVGGGPVDGLFFGHLVFAGSAVEFCFAFLRREGNAAFRPLGVEDETRIFAAYWAYGVDWLFSLCSQ